MAISTNISGSLKVENTVTANINGSLKELGTISTNISGVIKQIHSGEKCLDINLTSLTSSTLARTYTGIQSPTNTTPSASLYVPGIQTLLRVETDLSSLSSDFDTLKNYFEHMSTNGSGYFKDDISDDRITFVSEAHTSSSGNNGGSGSVKQLYATKDGDYLRFYLLKWQFSWSQTSGSSCTTYDITSPLKAKLYYR